MGPLVHVEDGQDGGRKGADDELDDDGGQHVHHDPFFRAVHPASSGRDPVRGRPGQTGRRHRLGPVGRGSRSGRHL